MAFIKGLAFSSMVCGIAIATALLPTSAAQSQDCPSGRQIARPQPPARVASPSARVKRVSFIDATGTTVRQQTVVIPAY
ncbi:MAG: hypothetical protein AAF268_11770 [Cyanobacteria bacterium P01_A01_bin.3]